MRFGEEVLSGDYDSVMLLLNQIENLDDYSWVEVIRLSDGSTEIRLTGRAFSKQLRLKTNGEITGDIPRHVRYMSGYTIPLYMIVDREEPVYPDFVFFK